MNRPHSCPRCGVALPTGRDPDAPCPRCLLELGFHEGESAAAGSSPAPAELAPHFPQLEILELVGRGGMGSVYRARQKNLRRDVALKILSMEASGDPAFAERFTREARALASLSHPNVSAVYDFGEAGGFFYLVLEYVDGANLRQILRAGRLSPHEALALVSQMCAALQYAHEHGVVHRDIKPENVLLDKTGKLKIVDFGLAKMLGVAPSISPLTRSNQAMGTLHYMAPEQIEHPLQVDHRADLFSLGVVFYELLTGELPLGRFEPPSQRVSIDVRLDDVVLKALAKEPDRRYQTAVAIRTDVDAIATSRPHRAPPPPPARTKSSGALKVVAVVAGIGLVVMLFFGCVAAALALFLGYDPAYSGEATGEQSFVTDPSDVDAYAVDLVESAVRELALESDRAPPVDVPPDAEEPR